MRMTHQFQNARVRLSESAVDLLWTSDQRSRIRRRLHKAEVLEKNCRMDPGPSAFFGIADPDVPVLVTMQVGRRSVCH